MWLTLPRQRCNHRRLALGADTTDILAELGYSEGDIRTMQSEQLI